MVYKPLRPPPAPKHETATQGKKRTRLSILNSTRGLQLFDGKVCVRVDADFAGNAHGFHGQVFGGQFRVFEHRARSREGVAAARANSHEPIVRLYDVAIAGEDESGFTIRDDEHGFQMTEGSVLAPVLGQLDGGFLQITGRFLQLAFETLE